MDVVVKSALMADKIKELLDGKTIDGVSFSFVDKKGMDMTFHAACAGAGDIDAAAVVKTAIKSTDYGKGIYFSVSNE